MEIVGDPVRVNLYPGGVCGPPGTVSHESFHRRREIILRAVVEEDSLQFYAQSEEGCINLGGDLGRLLHRFLNEPGGTQS